VLDRLFLPVEAQIFPAITDEECREIFTAGRFFVWHPAVGLVGYEPHEVLNLSDLIKRELPNEDSDYFSVSGTLLPGRLLALVPKEPPQLSDLLADGRDDIGTQTGDMENLLPHPNQPKPGLGTHLSKAGLQALSSGVRGLSNLLTSKQAGRGASATRTSSGSQQSDSQWLKRMQKWIDQRLSQVNDVYRSKRDRAIERLMDLLEREPDQGLKYALPFSGDAHRGVAPPTSDLGARDVDFNLGRLGGAHAVDAWDIPYQQQQALLKRYRELANREMNLGRYRRAAYIFAELLGDYHAAAQMLESGGHHHEAAVLYRDRLKLPKKAAESLAHAGLFEEACELFISVGENYEAGKLYRQIEQEDAAKQQFQIAMEEELHRHNHLRAAEILEFDLDDTDRSIEVLANAWPMTAQADCCLPVMLEALARHGRHEETRQRLQRLFEAQTPTPRELPLIECLSHAATKYPDRETKRLAADLTRLAASRLLRQTHVTERGRALRAVSKLIPSDQLLQRDCWRYQRMIGSQASGRSKSRPQRAKQMPVLVRSHSLKLSIDGFTVSGAVASGEAFFVSSQNEDGQLHVHRGSWLGTSTDRLTWKLPHRDASILMAAQPNDCRQIMVDVANSQEHLSPQVLQASDSVLYESIVGALWESGGSLKAAAMTSHGPTWCVVQPSNGEPLRLVACGRNQHLIYTRSLEEWDEWLMNSANQTIIPIMAIDHRVYLTVNDIVLTFDRTHPVRRTTLPGKVGAIVSSLPNMETRIAASMEHGGMLFWDDIEEGSGFQFATDLKFPRVTFNRGAFLIAAADRRCEVYSTQKKVLTHLASFDLNQPVAAVLPGVKPNEFGVVSEKGQIDLYRMDH